MPALVRALRDNEAPRRTEAAEDLGLIGRKAKAAIPVLTGALNDHNPLVRLRVAEALARIMPANKRAKPVLLEGLRDADPSVRKAAAEALGNVGVDALTTPALVAALTDPNSAVRWAAAEALGRAESEAEAAVPAAGARSYRSSRSIYRRGFAGRDWPCGTGRFARIDDLLKDADRNVRWTAALALVRIRTSAAEPAAPLFVEAIKSPDPRTRWDAVWYLQQLPRPERVISGIVALLKNADPGVRLGIGGPREHWRRSKINLSRDRGIVEGPEPERSPRCGSSAVVDPCRGLSDGSRDSSSSYCAADGPRSTGVDAG